jgi:hypothetical protein
MMLDRGGRGNFEFLAAERKNQIPIIHLWLRNVSLDWVSSSRAFLFKVGKDCWRNNQMPEHPV